MGDPCGIVYGGWAGIIGRKRQASLAFVFFDQLLQLFRTSLDVLLGIENRPDGNLLRRGRNQLHQSAGAFFGYRARIEL